MTSPSLAHSLSHAINTNIRVREGVRLTVSHETLSYLLWSHALSTLFCWEKAWMIIKYGEHFSKLACEQGKPQINAALSSFIIVTLLSTNLQLKTDEQPSSGTLDQLCPTKQFPWHCSMAATHILNATTFQCGCVVGTRCQNLTPEILAIATPRT